MTQDILIANSEALAAQLPANYFAQLKAEISRAISQKIDSRKLSEDEIASVTNYPVPLINQPLSPTDNQLKLLRDMARSWDSDIGIIDISSHRKFVGPFIVKLKRALFPFLRIALKGMLRRQREYNAATILLMADLCRENSGDRVGG